MTSCFQYRKAAVEQGVSAEDHIASFVMFHITPVAHDDIDAVALVCEEMLRSISVKLDHAGRMKLIIVCGDEFAHLQKIGSRF